MKAFSRFLYVLILAAALLLGIAGEATADSQTQFAGAVGATNDFTNRPPPLDDPIGAVGSETVLCAAVYETTWEGFWDDFNFAIPAGATIQGIQVDLMHAWREDPPGANSLGVVIGKDETTLATPKTGGPLTNTPDQNICEIYPIESYGGPADLWGLAWTPAELNSANFTARIYNADGVEFGVNLNWIRVTVTYTSLAIIKRAFWPDGTSIPTGASIPSGVGFKYLLYINNLGIARTDVTVHDVLDAAFLYQAGTIQVDNSLAECALTVCTPAEEQTIFTAVNGAAFLSDATDGDFASYTGASSSVDAGNENVANLQLDINANAVWAILFSVKMP